MLQAIGHVAIGDTQGQPLGNCRFADAGFADQHGVILSTARKDLYSATDFFIATDHRVQLSCARDFGEVTRKFLERVVTVFGARSVGTAATTQCIDSGVQPFGCDRCARQRLACCAGLGQRQREQQAFHSDIAIARLLRDLFGGIEHAHGVVVEAWGLLRAAAGHCGHLCKRRIGFAQSCRRVAACGLDQARRHPLFVLQQSL